MRKIQNWTDGELSFTQIEPPWWRRILRRPGRLYAKQWRAALAADRTEELVCSECGRDLHGYRGMPFEHREYFEMEARAEAAEARVSELEAALRLMLDMYDRHSGWCGYNKNAPGDHIHNTATRAARTALADDRTEEGEP